MRTEKSEERRRASNPHRRSMKVVELERKEEEKEKGDKKRSGKREREIEIERKIRD
jgi:hypothetical protein